MYWRFAEIHRTEPRITIGSTKRNFEAGAVVLGESAHALDGEPSARGYVAATRVMQRPLGSHVRVLRIPN
jgi:hypothetical protein